MEVPLSDAMLRELETEQQKALSLRRRIDELRLQLVQRAGECPRTPVVEEPPVQEPPSLAELLPKTPEPPVEEPPVKKDPPKAPEKVTPPKQPDPPKQEKQPEPPKPQKQSKGEDLSIPEDAQKNNDLSFLEGCWDSDSGLFNSRTGEPIKVKYCFDANGGGTRTILNEESNDRCVGPVRAKFSGGETLIIDADGAPCSKGGSFYGHDVRCTQSGNKALCNGKEKGGKKNSWDAKFKKS